MPMRAKPSDAKLIDLFLDMLAAEQGAGDNTLRLCPPLIINRDQCDFALDTLEACLQQVIAEA